MSTHPFIPLYVDDYEAATAHLTAEEDGVYSRLLRLCWRTPGCSLPNDPAWIARKVRLSASDYERVAKPVIEEFFKVQRGRLVQKRLKDEYENISRKKTARAKAGKKGGDAKALKTNETAPSNASDLPAHTRAFPEPEPEPKDIPPTPRGGRRKPEVSLPDGCPSAELVSAMQAEAREVGANLDLSFEARQFRDWWTAKDGRNRDWDACWRTWARRAIAKAPKTAAASLAGRQTVTNEDARWRSRCREFRSNRYWPTDDAGPRPGAPGCLAPAHILAEFGLAQTAANDTPKPDLFAEGAAA